MASASGRSEHHPEIVSAFSAYINQLIFFILDSVLQPINLHRPPRAGTYGDHPEHASPSSNEKNNANGGKCSGQQHKNLRHRVVLFAPKGNGNARAKTE